ncbi:parallel beta-helix repeat (two copies) [Acetitomaculum ruminis DSM 5522]|uniref:Parallel beta-helix repeat (Two copies) n=1 Tax=Acetitomaculum ruminis DSM 5522 TaxID=1120918 RepID=A0A1I1A0D3_9FIRM|nr:right-handed parallel beta-helix repeat-containing protein [Acetitomaculum ruminis]SFB30028.1 parallel beta-helix repeat (two copies) [Acetitomaculum ruminis DSM 5522]
MRNVTKMFLAIVLALGLIFFCDIATESELTFMEASAISLKTIKLDKGASNKDIQDALDVNSKGQYKLTVVIPKGTYKLDSTLYVYPNTTISAKGATLKKTKRYGAMVENVLDNDKGGYDGNHDITIDGGKWDSSPIMKKKGTETFRFIHCNNITIKNASLCNVPVGSHLIVFAGTRRCLVSNCKFYGYYNYKKLTAAKCPKEAIQLDIVHSLEQVPTKQYVCWDDLPCTGITISNNEFYKFSRGIGSHTAIAGRFHSFITISNNNFHDLSDEVMKLFNYLHLTINDNTIKNVRQGILAYTYLEAAEKDSYFGTNNKKVYSLPGDYDIIIENNTIKNVKDKGEFWGDGIRIIGGDERPIPGVIIRNNKISNTDRYGIFTTYANGIKILKNKIHKAGADGMNLGNSSFAVIKKNKISNTKCDGIKISVGSNYTNISSNTIKKYGMGNAYGSTYGIMLADCRGSKKHNILVKNNLIEGKSKGDRKDGIRTSNADYVKVLTNEVVSSGGCGVYSYNSKHAYIKGNKILKSLKNGINLTINCNDAKIVSNVISSPKSDGIFIFDSKASNVKANTINASKGVTGILINESNSSKILNNKVKGTTKKRGIVIIKSKHCKKKNNVIKVK